MGLGPAHRDGIEGGGTITGQVLGVDESRVGISELPARGTIRWPRAITVALMLSLAAWHMAFVLTYYIEHLLPHLAFMILAAAMCIYGLGPIRLPVMMAALERTLRAHRIYLVGTSAGIIAASHLITFSKAENVLLIMVFTTAIVAYAEFGGLTIRAMPYCAFRGDREAASNALMASSGYLAFVLLLTVVFSVGTLYAAVIAVVGFTSAWTVLIFGSAILGLMGLLFYHRSS